MAMASSSSMYPKVIHKQADGTIVLSPEQFTFKSKEMDGSDANNTGKENKNHIQLRWESIGKHQVAPASHSKALLKLILVEGNSLTFRLPDRPALERIRKDITKRLQKHPTSSNKKRSHAELTAASTNDRSSEFGSMDPSASAVARASLLAANATLRSQHHYLVRETQTLTEADFWKTHEALVEEEYAKIVGTTKAGSSSILQSHLMPAGDHKITLGVEEMRQIFILYPAVHKAYEEKVPLELSDEQFWRRYLESEFFHRDRGKLGTAAAAKGNNKLTSEQQDARAAAVGADDLFARYDQKLREAADRHAGGQGNAVTLNNAANGNKKKWGTRLAVGQFDLASTFETERGHLLEGPRDTHPSNEQDNGKGASVVRKYNRHWSMVLHPEEAVAGSDLMKVARKSVTEVLPNDEDSKAHGGVCREMKRLVNFANANEHDVNHVTGTGLEDEDYEALTLSNIEAYSFRNKSTAQSEARANETPEAAASRRKELLARGGTLQKMVRMAEASKTQNVLRPDDCHPEPDWGKKLLLKLTERIVNDAKTEEDRSEAVDQLDENFKKQLDTYFRRSSELLRHFFGLKRMEAQGNKSDSNDKKLAKIRQGLEAVYREMEEMKKQVQSREDEVGQMMGQMCKPIMDQLDEAFKFAESGSSGGGGGGFVEVS